MNRPLKILKNAGEFTADDMPADKLSDVFYALSDKIRLEIIRLLIDNEEMCVCKFQEIFKIPQPNLSFHLKILRKANLVKTRKKGTWMNYSLNGENPALKDLVPLIKKASAGGL